MERNFVYVSEENDGFLNLAADEWFLDHIGPQDLILYFYTNSNDVVIGKNQNPWVECNLTRMQEDGVRLLRRVSGGGAVYHDEGNLNFSFIAGKERYDQKRFFALIQRALISFGIEAELSGRNDLVVEGKKISGNAFAFRGDRALHHGTLLVDADLNRLPRYLNPDPKKIASKGIPSVRSRVTNLKDLFPYLTVKDVRNAVIRAFEEEYGYWGEWQFSPSERAVVEESARRYVSPEWQFGQTPKFDLEWSERFPWGGFQLFLSFERGTIARVKAYSDAMDPDLCSEAEACLSGLPFEEALVKKALLASEKEELRRVGEAISLK